MIGLSLFTSFFIDAQTLSRLDDIYLEKSLGVHTVEDYSKQFVERGGGVYYMKPWENGFKSEQLNVVEHGEWGACKSFTPLVRRWYKGQYYYFRGLDLSGIGQGYDSDKAFTINPSKYPPKKNHKTYRNIYKPNSNVQVKTNEQRCRWPDWAWPRQVKRKRIRTTYLTPSSRIAQSIPFCNIHISDFNFKKKSLTTLISDKKIDLRKLLKDDYYNKSTLKFSGEGVNGNFFYPSDVGEGDVTIKATAVFDNNQGANRFAYRRATDDPLDGTTKAIRPKTVSLTIRNKSPLNIKDQVYCSNEARFNMQDIIKDKRLKGGDFYTDMSFSVIENQNGKQFFTPSKHVGRRITFVYRVRYAQSLLIDTFELWVDKVPAIPVLSHGKKGCLNEWAEISAKGAEQDETYVWNGISNPTRGEKQQVFLQRKETGYVYIIDTVSGCRSVDSALWVLDTISIRARPGRNTNICTGDDMIDLDDIYFVNGRKHYDSTTIYGPIASYIVPNRNVPGQYFFNPRAPRVRLGENEITVSKNVEGCVVEDKFILRLQSSPASPVLTQDENVFCAGKPVTLEMQQPLNNEEGFNWAINGRVVSKRKRFTFTPLYDSAFIVDAMISSDLTNCASIPVRKVVRPDNLRIGVSLDAQGVDKPFVGDTLNMVIGGKLVVHTSKSLVQLVEDGLIEGYEWRVRPQYQGWNKGWLGNADPIVIPTSIARNYRHIAHFELSTISPNGCLTTSFAPIVYLPKVSTSIKDISQSDIKIYPSVVKNTLKVDNMPNTGLLSLYDINGRKVVEKKMTLGANELSLSMVSGGTYIVFISTNKEVYTTKIIKQ